MLDFFLLYLILFIYITIYLFPCVFILYWLYWNYKLQLFCLNFPDILFPCKTNLHWHSSDCLFVRLSIHRIKSINCKKVCKIFTPQQSSVDNETICLRQMFFNSRWMEKNNVCDGDLLWIPVIFVFFFFVQP